MSWKKLGKAIIIINLQSPALSLSSAAGVVQHHAFFLYQNASSWKTCIGRAESWAAHFSFGDLGVLPKDENASTRHMRRNRAKVVNHSAGVDRIKRPMSLSDSASRILFIQCIFWGLYLQ